MTKISKILLAFYIILLISGSLTFIIYPYFPTQDGPEHLFYVVTKEKVRQGDPFYSKYIYLNERFVPNKAFDDLTSVFMKIFPPVEAQKLLLFLTFIGLNLSFLLLLSSLSRYRYNILPIAILFVSLSFTFVLRAGLFNFYFGLVFLVLGLYLFIMAIRSKSIILILLLSLACFMMLYSHLFAWLIFLLIIFLYTFYVLIFEKDNNLFVRSVYVSVLSSIVPIILSLNFFSDMAGSRADSYHINFFMQSFIYFIQNIWDSIKIGFELNSNYMTIALLIGLLVIIIINRKVLDKKHFFICLSLLIMFLFLPSNLFDWQLLKYRFYFPFVILLLLTLSGMRLSRRQRTFFSVVFVSFSLLAIILIQFSVAKESRLIEESIDELDSSGMMDDSLIKYYPSYNAAINHIFGYYCMDHQCMHDGSWFNEPDTFEGGLRYSMGKSFDEQAIAKLSDFDYYVFNSRDYSADPDFVTTLNLTLIYHSGEWDVYGHRNYRQSII